MKSYHIEVQVVGTSSTSLVGVDVTVEWTSGGSFISIERHGLYEFQPINTAQGAQKPEGHIP